MWRLLSHLQETEARKLGCVAKLKGSNGKACTRAVAVGMEQRGRR